LSLATEGVLGSIGNTPLVELCKVVPAGCGRVFAKLEWNNPTGSMKDRLAAAVIRHAEADGRLQPGGTVVEYTAGTTGISLALVCAARGYGLEIVFSDAFSEEKRRTMLAFGARITDIPSEQQQITKTLVIAMIEKAAEIGRRPGHWFCDQLNNPDAAQGYLPLGEEIWRQTEGDLAAFVHAVSTSHSIHGVTMALWQHDPKIRVVAVEPAESAVLSGGPSGSHKIEGIGIGFIPPLWRTELVNQIEPVATAEAKAMTRRLAREEGIFAGTSSGANVVAAIRVARRLGPGAKVVTIICDSGLRYLSTDVFSPSTLETGLAELATPVDVPERLEGTA
jgi:cysteine synthase A